MAGPITWRSITAPSDASGVSLLNQAGQSFNNAFGAFDKAIGNVTQNRQKEYDHIVDTNTQTFMDEVAKYRTAEELQAARDAGVFDRMRAGFNGDVNSQQIRDLVPATMQTLQQRQLTGFQHEDVLRTRAEKGDIDTIKSLFQDGNIQQGNQMLDELTLSDEASLRSFRDQLLRQRTQDGREAARHSWLSQEQTEKAALRQRSQGINDAVVALAGRFDPEQHTQTQFVQELLRSLPGEATVAERVAAVQGLETLLTGGTSAASGDDKYKSQMFSALEKEYNYGSNIYKSYDPEKASEEVNSIVNDFTIKSDDGDIELLGLRSAKDRQEILTNLRSYATQGINGIPVPTDILRDALGSLKDRGRIYNSVQDLDMVVRSMVEGNPELGKQWLDHTAVTSRKNEIESNWFNVVKGGLPKPTPTPTQSTQTVNQQPPPEKDPLVQNLDRQLQAGSSQTKEVAPEVKPEPAPVERKPVITEDFVESFNNTRDMSIREGVSRATDWLLEARNANITKNREEKIQQIKDIALGKIDASKYDLSQFFWQNPQAIKSLSKEELNALRTKYGEAFINSFK